MLFSLFKKSCIKLSAHTGVHGLTVDGLEVCNPQIGRNISRRSGPGSWKQLNGVERELDSVWFPFAEGYPFVATLVAGWDGFHMSVNGKHITAFKYRQVNWSCISESAGSCGRRERCYISKPLVAFSFTHVNYTEFW